MSKSPAFITPKKQIPAFAMRRLAVVVSNWSPVVRFVLMTAQVFPSSIRSDSVPLSKPTIEM